VGEHNLFQIIGPLVFVAFAIGFAAVRYHVPYRVSAAFFALSYLLRSLGFMADYLRDTMPPDIAIYAAVVPFVAAGLAFCAGVFHLYSLRVPWWVIGAIGVSLLEFVTWYRFVEDSLAMRIVIMNGASAGVMIWLAIAMHHRVTRGIDRLLQLLFIANAMQFVMRTGITLSLEGGALTAANYSESMTALSLRFSITVATVAIAGTLFAIYGVEFTSRLTRSSQTDPLTGILNRRGFEAGLPRALKRLASRGPAHGLVIADIDGFKVVNDWFGHEAGDRVIARIAGLLEEVARDGDLVARWGGEEFVVLIPHGGESLARLYAESVRAAAERMGHDCLNGDAVTISFGVTEWRDGETLQTVCGRADAALYEAKQAGRNCVRTAEMRTPLRLVASVA
jgi:diguanylate cyclase (GGDEF)-like protein